MHRLTPGLICDLFVLRQRYADDQIRIYPTVVDCLKAVESGEADVTGDAYEGAQTASLTITSFQTGQTDGAFWCVVTDKYGNSVTSEAATLTLEP